MKRTFRSPIEEDLFYMHGIDNITFKAGDIVIHNDDLYEVLAPPDYGPGSSGLMIVKCPVLKENSLVYTRDCDLADPQDIVRWKMKNGYDSKW
jgi:hypothetical protein